MKLRERVKQLELKQKQNECDHSIGPITLTLVASKRYTVTMECWKCDKEFSRSVQGAEFDEMHGTLLDEINPSLKGK